MTLLTILRIAFLASLGVHLLSPNEPCRVIAGVSGIALAIFILVGKF